MTTPEVKCLNWEATAVVMTVVLKTYRSGISLVVKNSLSNAGDSGSIPGQGTKTPHTSGQLSLCTTKEKTTGHN